MEEERKEQQQRQSNGRMGYTMATQKRDQRSTTATTTISSHCCEWGATLGAIKWNIRLQIKANNFQYFIIPF